MANPTNGGPQTVPGVADAASPTGPLPQLNVLGQYIKDFSFENPNAPRSLQPTQAQPSINIQINVNAKPIADSDIEVELRVEGKAESAGNVLFAFELAYAGVFRLTNVPKESVQPLALIECPRLLFPFVRRIVADTISEGGFPPIMLQPVDFAALFRARAESAAATKS